MSNGIVLYCDAGARPTNPGFVGWGIHGYVYTTDTDKKTSTPPGIVVTNDGYMLKSVYDDQSNIQSIEFRNTPLQTVSVLEYLDGIGNFNHTTTNNVGELNATLKSLEYCNSRDDIGRINILTDSKYVCLGITDYLEMWNKNNWIKNSGGPISNLDMWKTIYNLIKELESKNIELNIDWVKGHDGNTGNEIADKYSTVGILRAMKGVYCDEILSISPENYWKWEVDIHPFISHKGLLFNTLDTSIIPGEYYLCDNIRDIDLLGKKSADGAYSFIKLSTPNDTIEAIRKHQSKVSGSNDHLILMRLPYVFEQGNNRDINRFKEYSIYQKDQYRQDLYGLNNEPVTRELKPAKLAIRAVEALSDLSDRLHNYLEGDPKYAATDITNLFFDISTVIKKKQSMIKYKLNSSISLTTTTINVDVNYHCNGITKQKQIPITLGIDLPNRNSLKKLEAYSPLLTLITWNESSNAFRYAIVITTANNDCGIWAGVYSNLILLQD